MIYVYAKLLESLLYAFQFPRYNEFYDRELAYKKKNNNKNIYESFLTYCKWRKKNSMISDKSSIKDPCVHDQNICTVAVADRLSRIVRY